MQTSLATPVQNPDLYHRVYSRYRSYLHRVVLLHGVPASEMEDAVSAIILRMCEKDGLAKFEGEVTDERLRKFVTAYFRLGALAERSRVNTYKWHTVLDDPADRKHNPPAKPEVTTDWPLFDELAALLEGDALEYLQACAEHQTFVQAKAYLLEQGWTSLRVRRALVVARAAVKSYLCQTS